MHIDVFNGDADGLCGLQQLRLAEPVDSILVTGVKRDIDLLSRVAASAGDIVTVLDISFDKNREAVEQLLTDDIQLTYFDHHFAGDIPAHPNLQAHIDTSPKTCTSLIVDEHIGGHYRLWAIVGAFGDNMEMSARARAEGLGLSEQQLQQLQQLGICLNYNGYGASLEDLFFPPDALFRQLHPYADPFDFIAGSDSFGTLLEGYQGDMANAGALTPERADEAAALFVLPPERWARRVSGVFGNQLARQAPGRAHAVLSQRADGRGYQVSVRAPLDNLRDADTLCRQFASGGGRKGAAGINQLPEAEMERFISAFWQTYSH